MSDYDTTADSNPTVEATPEPVAESTSNEELAALFKEAFGGDSGAKETTEAVVPEETPARATAEAHQPKEDPKDREIAELRNRLDGVMPRYQALQKDYDARIAEEKAGREVATGKDAELLEEYGEIGNVILDLKKQLAALQEKASVLPEVHAEILSAKEKREQAAQAAEFEATQSRLAELGHKDFIEVSRSPGFKQWVGNLPPEDRRELETSNSPRVYAAFLDDYKATLKSLPSRTTADIRAERERRIANATTVDSKPSGASASNERESVWKRAFNS